MKWLLLSLLWRAFGEDELPSVAALLPAEPFLDDGNAEVAQHLQGLERQSEQRLGQLRSGYEQRLRNELMQNGELRRENAHLAKEILLARQSQAELEKKVSRQQRFLSFRLSELGQLRRQLRRAERLTEDEGLSFLELAATPEEQVRSFLKGPGRLVDADLDEDPPEEQIEKDRMIQLLQEDLQQLRSREGLATEKLKHAFEERLAETQAQRNELQQQQVALKEELQKTQAAKEAQLAKSRQLASRLVQLRTGLHDGGQRFGRLAAVATAAPERVPQLLRRLA